MSAKLIISLIIFISSLIILFIVRKKEIENKTKEVEEKNNKKKEVVDKPKLPSLEIISNNEPLKKVLSEFTKIENQLLIPIGLVSEEKLKLIDFQEENNILIVGTTGGGKSVCLNDIVFSLAMNYSKDEIDIVTMDTSIVELSSFNKIPQYLKETISDPSSIMNELSILQKEAEKRIQNNNPKKLIVIIDDLYDICNFDKSVIKTIEYLLRISKESNIYYILATDTPDLDILTPNIKEKLDATLYLTLAPGEEKDFSFERELSEEDLSFLAELGNVIYKKKDTTKKVTIPDVTDKDIKKLKDWFIENR